MFVFRQLADSAGFSSMFRLVVLHIRERMPVSQPGEPARRARHGPRRPGDGGVIAAASAAGSGTASARRARAACSRQLPGRSPEAAPGAAAPGLARKPQLAVAAGGGIGAAMGLTDPADPGGDNDAAQPAGPLHAARIERACSGAAQDEPRAPQEPVGEQEPGAGQGDLAAGAGRPPQAAGEESQDEPLVSGDDGEDLPAAQVAAAGATADPVKDYLKQIGKVPLLTAGQEVELAKRIEAGLFADHKLAGGSGVLRPARASTLSGSPRTAGGPRITCSRPTCAWSSRWPGGTPAGGCCSWT